MSILERMRGSTDSTPMQIVLVLIVVAFIGWFSLPSGQTVQVAVDVNGERVLSQEFFLRLEAEKRLRMMALQRRLTDEEEASLTAEVKDIVASELVVSQHARSLGYAVHPDEAARLIRSDPRFQLDDGTFDKEAYQKAQKNSGRSRADFEADFVDRILRDKLRSAVTLGVQVPLEVAREQYNEALTTFDIASVRLDPTAVLAAEPITDEERATWMADNADKLQAAYDKDKALKYDLPERVQLATIRLSNTTGDPAPLVERLQAVKAELDGGAEFATRARRWSEDPSAPAGGDLGERRVPTLTDAVRDAIDGLQPGQVSEVVDEGDVVSLYQVVSRTPAEKIPLEAVQDELAEVAMRAERVAAIADQIAETWKTGPLDPELLERLGTSVTPLKGLSLRTYRGGPDDPPMDAIQAIVELEGEERVAGPFSRPGKDGDVLYVVRLAKRNLPDEAKAPGLPNGLETYRTFLTLEERNKVWEAYVADLRTRAAIDTGGGEATQGGWRSYLAWLLPDG